MIKSKKPLITGECGAFWRKELARVPKEAEMYTPLDTW